MSALPTLRPFLHPASVTNIENGVATSKTEVAHQQSPGVPDPFCGSMQGELFPEVDGCTLTLHRTGKPEAPALSIPLPRTISRISWSSYDRYVGAVLSDGQACIVDTRDGAFETVQAKPGRPVVNIFFNEAEGSAWLTYERPTGSLAFLRRCTSATASVDNRSRVLSAGPGSFYASQHAGQNGVRLFHRGTNSTGGAMLTSFTAGLGDPVLHRQVAATGALVESSPDGIYFSVLESSAGRVGHLDVIPQTALDFADDILALTWAPVGLQLAALGARRWGIFEVTFGRKKPGTTRRVLASPQTVELPAEMGAEPKSLYWSPDAKSVAIVAPRYMIMSGTQSSLESYYKLDATAAVCGQVVTFETAAWSPDSRFLALIVASDCLRKVIVVDTAEKKVIAWQQDSHKLLDLIADSQFEYAITWTPTYQLVISIGETKKSSTPSQVQIVRFE